MPELPEVETVKNALQKAFVGARIEKVEVRCARLRQPVPADLAKKLKGKRIENLRRIGKYMVLDLAENLSLVWHLGMSGSIRILENKPQSLEKHDHVVLQTDKGYMVYNDPRRFGLLTWCLTDQLKKHPLFKRIGVDPFDTTVTVNWLAQKFEGKNSAVKLALLDQEIMAGIGNIYASEALYAARILPTRPAGSLSKKELGRLIEAVRDVLQKAIAAGGSTLKDYRQPDGSLGYFQMSHCVYDKTGQRCPNCRCDLNKTGGVQKIVLGGRSTFYCATQQK